MFGPKFPYFTIIARVHQGGCRWGLASLQQKYAKKHKGGDQGEIYPLSTF